VRRHPVRHHGPLGLIANSWSQATTRLAVGMLEDVLASRGMGERCSSQASGSPGVSRLASCSGWTATTPRCLYLSPVSSPCLWMSWLSTATSLALFSWLAGSMPRPSIGSGFARSSYGTLTGSIPWLGCRTPGSNRSIIRSTSRTVSRGSPAPRMILADEVGLGKTIEAGLILKELRARESAARTLILVPANLATQWQQELRVKFNEDFTILDGDAARHFGRDGSNPFAAGDSIIASLAFASREQPDRTDLLSCHGTSSSSTRRTGFG
jgi:hypothetical protein